MIRAYLEAIPALEGSEALRQATIVAVGSGTIKSSQARTIQSRWQRAAGGGRLAVGLRAILEMAPSIGIGVERRARKPR